MGSINITSLEKIQPRSTIDDRVPRQSGDEYTYRDVKLDIKLGKVVGNKPADKLPNSTDIQDIRDLEAIKQSVVNIFNTRPGQKLLNPYLGLDLSDYVFDPITEQTADLLARAVLKGLAAQEPRVDITGLQVIGDIPGNRYQISFILQLPNLNTSKARFNGILTTGGFQL